MFVMFTFLNSQTPLLYEGKRMPNTNAPEQMYSDITQSVHAKVVKNKDLLFSFFLVSKGKKNAVLHNRQFLMPTKSMSSPQNVHDSTVYSSKDEFIC